MPRFRPPTTTRRWPSRSRHRPKATSKSLNEVERDERTTRRTMRLGIREFIFVTLMIGLLASTWIFVFKKSATRREQKQGDIAQMDRALSNLHSATAGID